VLFGASGSEAPDDKEVFVDGGLIRIGDLRQSEIKVDEAHDLAVVHVGIAGARLPSSVIAPPTARIIALHGYLARDFRRSLAQGVLRPAPFIYQNLRRPAKPGFVALKFPRKNIGTFTSTRAHAPIPKGLSGGPMLDAIALWHGHVSIQGVFIEHEQDVGLGGGGDSVLALLASL
jgi:hypothetical protein